MIEEILRLRAEKELRFPRWSQHPKGTKNPEGNRDAADPERVAEIAPLKDRTPEERESEGSNGEGYSSAASGLDEFRFLSAEEFTYFGVDQVDRPLWNGPLFHNP